MVTRNSRKTSVTLLIVSVTMVLYWLSLTASVSLHAEPAVTLPGENGVATSGPQAMTLPVFLDRLMHAESDGLDHAANPRSSARGAFQFISSTFLSVTRKHFPQDIQKLTLPQILSLRSNRKFSRKTAEAYTRDNATYLASNGIKPTFTHLRLAFLLGPYGARRIVHAKHNVPLTQLLSRAVLRANPFMTRLSAGGLIAKAAKDIAIDPKSGAALPMPVAKKAARKGPEIHVSCNLTRPSCRRWLALKKRRLKRLTLRKVSRRK